MTKEIAIEPQSNQLEIDKTIVYDKVINDLYSFMLGVNWALENQWKNTTELPKLELVVIVSDGHDYWFNHRTKDTEILTDENDFCKINDLEIKFWMPVPKISKCN